MKTPVARKAHRLSSDYVVILRLVSISIMENKVGQKEIDEMVGIRIYLNAHKSEDGFEPRGLPQPTQARPGSREKVAILAARIEQGVDLYHPLDNPIPLATLDRRFHHGRLSDS